MSCNGDIRDYIGFLVHSDSLLLVGIVKDVNYLLDSLVGRQIISSNYYTNRVLHVAIGQLSDALGPCCADWDQSQ